MEMLLEDETPALNRSSFRYCDRSLNFYAYCYAKSAIFGKGDRAIFNSYALRSSSWR
jgi:hypothetical protein